MDYIKELIESYERKLNAIQALIDNLQTNCPNNPDYVRLITKRSCYRVLITELEWINNDKN